VTFHGQRRRFFFTSPFGNLWEKKTLFDTAMLEPRQSGGACPECDLLVCKLEEGVTLRYSRTMGRVLLGLASSF
jgi:hypothetical protein